MEMEKRLKRSSVDEIDRISGLPDSVLLHILSFLDMKDVVRTSVLSKKWEYIWTSVPTLTFEYNLEHQLFFSRDEVVKEKLLPFVMSINKTLFQCQINTVRKFHIKSWYMKMFASDVDLWAHFVARNSIQDVSLEFSGFESYELPRSLCQNSSLSSLSLSKCTISLGVKICWTSLKSLSIESMKLDNNIMTKILSGAPMLQVLKIDYSREYSKEYVHIKSNSLRVLVICSCVGSLIDISAPNLQSLCIRERVVFGKMLLCSSSLFKAELDFQFDYDDSEKEQCMSKFMTIIESIRHVVQLEVGSYFLENLSLLGNNKSLSSPFSRLTFLKFTGIMDKPDIVGIICLLKCSPNLEKLVLNKKDRFKHNKDRNQFLLKLADKYWESKRRMEKFELPYLKTVKFNGFKEVNEFTRVLIQLLLENAILIDNIVIDMGEIQMIVTPTPRVV